MNGKKPSQSETLSLCHSVEELPQAPWDATIGETPSAQHGSLKTYETTNTLATTPHYFVLGERNQPSAVAIGYLSRTAEQYERIARPLLGRAQFLTPALVNLLGPTLILGLRPTYGPALLANNTRSKETQISNLHSICGHIEDWADDQGLSIAVVGLTDHDQAVIETLREREFHETFGHPTAELDVCWNSWDGYLQILKGKRRNVIRREAKTFASSGCRIRRLEMGEPMPSVSYDLVRQHQDRKKSKTPPYRKSLFAELCQNLRNNTLIYLAEYEDQTLGVAALLYKDSVAAAAFLGIASEVRATNMFVYFNLAYYRLVRDAPALGIKRILYGTNVYQGKSQRGCKVIPTRLFVRPRKSLARVINIKAIECHRHWYERKFSHLYTQANM